jgi:hypothetical protein
MISDEDRVKNIRKRLNSYGSVDAAEIEFLLKLLVKETYGRYSCFEDEEIALIRAKKLWGEE